jgi:pimeloyl-ACP methyl ester carboxylesterase
MQRQLSGDDPGTTTEGAPPLGRYYEVAGRRLLLHRSGSGSPAVVFLSGGGAVGLDYFNVQERAAQLTTSVIYDRAGTGWSDRVELPRSSAEVTDELRELLRTAGVPAPYLLVGHSLGGFYARHYAHRFPGEVAGLVLLDPAHEDYDAYMPEELVEIWHAWDPDQALPHELPDEVIQFYRGLFGAEMTDWPKEVREPLIERHVSPEWLRVGFQEAKNLGQLNDELRRTGKMPDVPLIILTAMGIDPFKQAVSGGTSEALLREEIEGKRRLYTALAESVSQGENRLVDDVGHVTLHLRRPDAVQQAIQDLLGRIGM